MKWKNLQDYKCPKCGSSLYSEEGRNTIHKCDGDCDFSINENKYENIINNFNQRKYQEPDRSSWLSEI